MSDLVFVISADIEPEAVLHNAGHGLSSDPVKIATVMAFPADEFEAIRAAMRAER